MELFRSLAKHATKNKRAFNSFVHFSFIKQLTIKFAANTYEMKLDKMNTRTAVLITLIFGAACFRFMSFPPNFSPMTGMALFGAAYFSRKYLALIVPFVALWLSSMVLDNIFYAHWYEGFQWFSQPWVFVAFGIIVLLGFVILKKVNFGRVVGASVLASVLFFLISNFGVWYGSPTIPHTLDGLMATYAAGIPFLTNPGGAEHFFFLNSVIGDLFFTGILFGAFELVKLGLPQLATQRS